MKRFKGLLGLPVYAVLTILLLGGLAGATFAASAPVAVGVSPAKGGPRTHFVGTFIVPRVAPGRIVEAALTSLKTTGPYPCATGNYPVFHTPVGQRAHVTFKPGAGYHWCPGTYHVQVDSVKQTGPPDVRVLGSSKIVHVL